MIAVETNVLVYAHRRESTEHAAVLMIHGGFRHLPVTEGGDVVGMLSIRDLMRVVLEDAVPRGA